VESVKPSASFSVNALPPHRKDTFNALAVLNLLKQSGADLPFILISGQIGEDLAVAVMKAGAHDYVPKNDLARLVPVIQRERYEAVIRRERRQSDEALRESEERLRLALDVARMGTWDWNMVTNQAVWSEGLKRIYGYDPAGNSPTTYEEFLQSIYPDDREYVLHTLERSVVDGVAHEIEFRIVRPDGSIKWITARGQVFRDERGAAQRMIGVAIDITERKMAEEALRQSERKFHAIFDQTFQLAALLTPDGTLLEANQAALNFSGLQHAEVKGRPFWEGPWMSSAPASQERMKSAIAAAAEGQFVRYEIELSGAQGSVTLDFSLKPVKDEAGRVTLLIAEGRDITERQQLEEARRKQERTTGRLEQLTVTVNTLQHEINNPLAIIVAQAQLLARSENLTERERGRAMNIEEAAKRVADLVKRLSSLREIKVVEQGGHPRLQLESDREETGQT
jgi:PAS domain S-box-containing protein